MLSYKRSLSLNLFFKKGDSCIQDYLPKSPYFYSGSVRSGLLDVLDSLKIGENDIVLFPSFVAQGLVMPFKRKGVEIKYYHISEELAPDISDIEEIIRLTKNKIKAVIFIHYFGIFQKPVYELKVICNKNNIILLEDCVHGLFSKNDSGEPIGSAGDISFFSFPKSLPVPDGAIFFVNNNSISLKLSYRRSFYHKLSVLLQLFYLFVKRGENKIHSYYFSLPLNLLNKIIYYLYYHSVCNVKSNTRISKITLKLINRIDFSEFINRKLFISKYYQEKLNAPASILIFSDKCTPNSITSGFPLMLNENYKDFSRKLKRKGIEILSYKKHWDYIPLTGGYYIERKILMNHVLLPINNEFKDNDLEYIITNVNLILNETVD